MHDSKSFTIPAFLLIALSGLTACGSTSENETPTARTVTSPTPQPGPSAEETAKTEDGMKTAPSGLQYQDLEIGVGQKPFLGQTLLVAYTGYSTKGVKFDSGTLDYRPGKDKMIKGFEMGIIGSRGIEPMREGGKRKLIIPPELGYGDQIMGTIPPNSTLVFEIELLRIKNTKMGF